LVNIPHLSLVVLGINQLNIAKVEVVEILTLCPTSLLFNGH